MKEFDAEQRDDFLRRWYYCQARIARLGRDTDDVKDTDPSLHFKKVKPNLWSVRITRNYRALALKKGDDYYWIWIGSHDEYDRLLSR